jgi:hypothetical protein
MQEYYVYIYFDPRETGSFIYGDLKFEFEPFYIGKGKDRRMYEHLAYTNRCFKTNKIKAIRKANLEPIIVKYREDMYEHEAYSLETELIKKIGRKHFGEGPLANFVAEPVGATYSGEENPFYGKTHSKRWRERKSKQFKEWQLANPEEVRRMAKAATQTRIAKGTQNTFTGKKHTEQAKRLIGLNSALKQKGERNSQYGSCWMIKDGEVKKVSKSQIENYLLSGWQKGRK